MKKVLLLAVIFAAISMTNSEAYEPPECLRMACPDDWSVITQLGCFNQDSVMVDTCMCPDFDLEDRTSNCLYALGNLLIEFKSYCYPFSDIIGEGEVRRPSDIIFPSVRAFFEDMENTYSEIYFTDPGYYPGPPDSIRPCFIINFEKYSPINVIINSINEFQASNDTLIYYRFESQFGCNLLSVEDIYNNELFISPTPSANEIILSLPAATNDMILIFNESGKKVKEMPYSEKVNISDLPSGVYFIQIGNYRNKFIKK